MEEKKKHAGGAPTKYKTEYCQQIIKFRSEGWSLYKIAMEWDVAVSCLWEWRRKHQEFSVAYKKAHTAFKAWAIGYIKSHVTSKNLNQTALIYMMKLLQIREYDDEIDLPDDFSWPKTIEEKQLYIDELVTTGKISFDCADRLMNIVTKQAKLQEHIDFESRLTALEQRGE